MMGEFLDDLVLGWCYILIAPWEKAKLILLRFKLRMQKAKTNATKHFCQYSNDSASSY